MVASGRPAPHSLSAMLAILALAVVALSLLLVAVRSVRSLAKSRGGQNGVRLPGPLGLPLIGASYLLGSYEKPWDGFAELRRRYGDLYGLRLGSRYCLVVSSLQAMRQILVNKATEFSNRPDFLRFHAIFRGDRNLSFALCDWSSKQKTRRELSYPFMHPRTCSLSHLSQILVEELEVLKQNINGVLNQVVEPRNLLLTTAAQVFYRFLCSKRFPDTDSTFLRTVTIYNQVFQELFQGFAVDFMPWLKIFNQNRLQKLRHDAREVGLVTDAIFHEHEATLDRENPRDLVDILLANASSSDENHITREDAEVIIDDLIGGHSVLTNLWLWGLYLLAYNPEVVKKIRNEVDRVTAGGCRPCSMQDRPDLPYTEATVLEALRVISSPIIPHVANQDTVFEGYNIPKGTMVMFNTYDLHLDKDLWQEPDVFRPERFLNAEGRVSKPDHFFPFSVGKRTCLGDGLVKALLLLGFTNLVQHFDIVPDPEMAVWTIREIAGVVIAPQEIRLSFQKRKNLNQKT